MTLDSLRKEVRWAVEAAQDKQAVDITVLKLAGAGSFAEYFLLCSGRSQPQIKAISDAIEERLERGGNRFHRVGRRTTDTIGAAITIFRGFGKRRNLQDEPLERQRMKSLPRV